MENNTALTVDEVAHILKIAKNTVYELIKRGELPSYRVGRKVRIDLRDVESYINIGKKNNSLYNEPRSLSSFSHEVDSPNSRTVSVKQQNDEFVICGQDVILDILSRYLGRHPTGISALRSYIGSYNGLIELYHNRAQLATAHLWDGDSGEYNIPYVRRLLPGIPCKIINLTYRMQGFYVKVGNPKNITLWEDLSDTNVRIINREKGSGTRILLDEKLRLLSIPSGKINGYSSEEYSHLSVASAVARGDADVGIGNEKAALQVKDIEFIPLQKERYDLIMLKENYLAPVNQAVMEILNSSEFKNELRGLGGYDISDMGKLLGET